MSKKEQVEIIDDLIGSVQQIVAFNKDRVSNQEAVEAVVTVNLFLVRQKLLALREELCRE